jgi:HK97 family phage major capsid protein
MSVVGHVTTGSNAVSWVQWTPNPPSAAPVVAEGAAKPEATMTAAPVSATLQTYAHWKEITRQALEDIPQIRSIVETRLRQGIARALELASVTALGAATIPPAQVALGGTLTQAIRKGLAVVQSNGYTPNAVLVNPMDAADIDLGIMAGTLLGPVQTGTMWGLRVVAIPDLPAGTAYVGDFQSAVTIFDRGTTSVYLTDSHADNFVKNILLLLAEIRALVTVPEPQAAAECSVSATTGTAAATSGGK